MRVIAMFRYRRRCRRQLTKRLTTILRPSRKQTRVLPLSPRASVAIRTAERHFQAFKAYCQGRACRGQCGPTIMSFNLLAIICYCASLTLD